MVETVHCLVFSTTVKGNQQWKHYPLRIRDTGKGNHPAELLHNLEFHTSDKVLYSKDSQLINASNARGKLTTVAIISILGCFGEPFSRETNVTFPYIVIM
jgi:hypothetical protein